MSTYTIHARAFHPDAGFGAGGLFFSGDNRGFSANVSPQTTSRIRAFWEIDVINDEIGDRDVRSDKSSNPITGIEELYIEKSKQPNESATLSMSKFFPTGMQTGSLRWRFGGINHGFTTSEWFNNLVVPSLDCSGTIVFSFFREEENPRLRIDSFLLGDGFPNSEVFIEDSAGTRIFLHTHHRFGYAAKQLIGEGRFLLGGTLLEVGIDGSGNFLPSIVATRCVDFMPGDRDLLIEHDGFFYDTYDTQYDIEEWNEVHSSRVPTEEDWLGFDTDDALPLPMIPLVNPRTIPKGQDINNLDDLVTSPGPEDLEDWDH